VASTFKTELCGGGGDFPEAMDQAMEAAATELVWRTGNVARVALVVADAPPHNEHLRDALESALKMRRLGVRLYGLAASGVAQTAEYLMRLTALVTGARYAWLTDDSGIGNPHAEPSVVCYKVTRLDSLLVRILQGELLGRRIEAEEGVIREVGSQVKGVCIVDVDPPEVTPDETPDESTDVDDDPMPPGDIDSDSTKMSDEVSAPTLDGGTSESSGSLKEKTGSVSEGSALKSDEGVPSTEGETSKSGGVISDATDLAGGVISDTTDLAGGVISDTTDLAGTDSGASASRMMKHVGSIILLSHAIVSW